MSGWQNGSGLSELMNNAFSESVSLNRANPVGLVLMAAAVVLIVAAKPVSGRFPEARRERVFLGTKLAGLLICCLGAAIAVM